MAFSFRSKHFILSLTWWARQARLVLTQSGSSLQYQGSEVTFMECPHSYWRPLTVTLGSCWGESALCKYMVADTRFPLRRADWIGELHVLSTASVSLPVTTQGTGGHLWNAWTDISSHEIKGRHRQFSPINQYKEPSPRDFLPLKLRKGMGSVVMKFFLMMFGNHSREHQNPLLVGNAFLRTWRVLVLNQQDVGNNVHQNAWLNHC